MTANELDATVNTPGISGYKYLNNRQTLFIGYMLCVLVDLVVLNLYVEFWDKVVIDSFLLSLLTAGVLQLLLKIVMKIEHRIATYFNAKEGTGAKVMRWLSAWAVVFGSKFVMLWIVDIVFGEHVELGGIISFYAVIFSIIITEIVITRFYYALADK